MQHAAKHMQHALTCGCLKIWRCCWQVPYTLKNEEIPDDWECRDNKWDRMYAACTMAQALTDEEIDGILNGQKSLQPPAEPETADADTAEYAPASLCCSTLLCSLVRNYVWTV